VIKPRGPLRSAGFMTAYMQKPGLSDMLPGFSYGCIIDLATSKGSTSSVVFTVMSPCTVSQSAYWRSSNVQHNQLLGGILALLQKMLNRRDALFKREMYIYAVSGGITLKWQEFKARAKMGLQRFMYGRNGVDQLTMLVLVSSVVVLFVASTLKVPWLQLLYYAGVLYALYRALSRDLVRRRKENYLFLQKTRSVTSWFRVQKRIIGERKTHRHFKCPSCKQRLRVPVGKGKITITCSKCGEKFSRKS
jgi:hypothetical protein